MLWQMISPAAFAVLSVVLSAVYKKEPQKLNGVVSAYCTVRAAWRLCGRSGWLCEAAFGKAMGAAILCAIMAGTLSLLWLLEKKENSPLFTLLYIAFCMSEGNNCLGIDAAACALEVGSAGKTALFLLMTAIECVYLLLSPVPEIIRVIGSSALLFRGLKGMEKNSSAKMFCIGAAAAVVCSFIG